MLCRVALLFTFILSFAFLPAFAAPPQVISVEEYRAQLHKADEQLQKMEDRAPRNIAPVLQSLAADQIIRRADGQTQSTGSQQWQRWLDEFSPTVSGAAPTSPVPPTEKANSSKPAIPAATSFASRADVQHIRETIALRLRALDNWAGSTYQSADAQTIIKQLENSGQIRTGPTWLEQTWINFRKWISQTFQNFLKWIGGWFPAVSPGQMPKINATTIKVIFTLTVAALLVFIALLIWRAIGGKVGRKHKKQGAFAFSPEDAELLALPPDELRERAHRFAAEGNFRDALRHLYISLLLNFDARGVWRYDARRTNWEHISALQSDAGKSSLVVPLSDITRHFDRVRYGNASCTQSDWQGFQTKVDALEKSATGS